MHFYKAILTKYHGPTNTRGSRVSATDDDGNRISVPYDDVSGLRNPHMDVAIALCKKMGWKGTLTGGHTKNGMCFVFVNKDSEQAIDG